MAWLIDLPVRARRVLLAALVLATVLMVAVWMTLILTADGFTLADLGMVLLFTGTATMVALTFWSSLVGALLLRDGEPPAAIAPRPGDDPITSRVALVVPVCDEIPEEVFARLHIMKTELDRGQGADRFTFVILSDSRDRALRAREEGLIEGWRRAHGGSARLHYRHRADNRGFKAGNVYDFCSRAGDRFDLMVVLDADSLMSGAMIRRLVRIMQARPKIGILQPLIVGLPAASPFVRIFQFGMRHGMRAYATGCAWWQADEGSFWGHNAIVRMRPFGEHCRMPEIAGTGPLSGPVLSHDQLEAVLMRAGGHEVRVLPVEDGSLEQNPPTLLDFVRRDLRWCQGNMQYVKLLGMAGIRPLGRLQLVLAIMLFLVSPMWLGFLALGLTQAVLGERDAFLANVDPALGIGLFVLMMTMAFAPKLIGVAETLLSKRRSAAYGGRARLLAGATVETLFSALLGPIMAVAHTLFIGGLLVGRRIRWQAQTRAERRIPLRQAWLGLWPQSVLGAMAAGLLALEAPTLLPWAAPVLAGLVLAVPFARLTSSPRLGAWLADRGLCATPEEVAAGDPQRRGWQARFGVRRADRVSRAERSTAALPLSGSVTPQARST